jgi:L-seryl-tRNA(Ser) seleniumtransferase
MSNPFRQLPSVHDLLQHPALAATTHDRGLIAAALRAEIDLLRERLGRGESIDDDGSADAVVARAKGRLDRELRPRLRRVINATGIVLHTNLGRAPLAEEAARAAYEAACGYLNLELDLATGKRSSRQTPIREWICRLTGAESATAVNNNAAATVIALRALCAGKEAKEVIVSRGQLIEIGGSFRIPEIMAASGARLVEVGTTNITRLADYERAVTPGTAALLRVHPSNYRVHGFTESVPIADLVAVGARHGIAVIDDIGSGALVDFGRFGFDGEPMADASIRAGADLVLFSGDKLLGGPQAGILAGKKRWIDAIEKDPLMRAFRLDKMTLAALEATLRLHVRGQSVPVLAMLALPLEELRSRAEMLAGRLAAVDGIVDVTALQDEAYVGGGSLPDQALATWVVALRAARHGDDEFAARLRLGDPAVLGRTRDGKMLLDMRTVFPEDNDALLRAVAEAAR